MSSAEETKRTPAGDGPENELHPDGGPQPNMPVEEEDRPDDDATPLHGADRVPQQDQTMVDGDQAIHLPRGTHPRQIGTIQG